MSRLFASARSGSCRPRSPSHGRRWHGALLALVVFICVSPRAFAQEPTWGSGQPPRDEPGAVPSDASTPEPPPPSTPPIDLAIAPPDPAATATPRRQLRTNVAVDLTVSGVMAASLIAWGVAIKPNLSAPSCTICDGSNGTVNGVDDFFRTTFKLSPGSSVGTVSDVSGYAVGPLAGVALAIAVPAHDGRVDEAPENLLLITEATLVFTLLQQGITFLLPRERPAFHAEPAAERSLQRHSSFESFPGGHNGLGFAIAAAGGTVATMRGYRLAPLVWIIGGAIAATTTYLRLAADRHYFTDLMAGAALGIGTGIAVPLIFHRPIGERTSGLARPLHDAMVSTTEVPGGRVVGVGWTF
jgi:membrane-associated phospholipid phosphatase